MAARDADEGVGAELGFTGPDALQLLVRAPVRLAPVLLVAVFPGRPADLALRAAVVLAPIG